MVYFITLKQINQGVALYIINSEGIVYHQPEWAVYHQAAEILCTPVA